MVLTLRTRSWTAFSMAREGADLIHAREGGGHIPRGSGGVLPSAGGPAASWHVMQLAEGGVSS